MGLTPPWSLVVQGGIFAACLLYLRRINATMPTKIIKITIAGRMKMTVDAIGTAGDGPVPIIKKIPIPSAINNPNTNTIRETTALLLLPYCVR